MEAGESKGYRESESNESHFICCTKGRMSSKRKLFPGMIDINVTGSRKQTSKGKLCTALSRRVSGFTDQGELVVARFLPTFCKVFNTIFYSTPVVKLRRHVLNRQAKNSLNHEVQRVLVNNPLCQLIRCSMSQ